MLDPALSVPPFVDATWLAGDHGPVVLVDLRWALDGSEGHDTYLAGHLPGAVYVDLDTVASGPASPAVGRHPLPEPEDLAASLGDLGIADDVIVVAYDQGPGVIAARLVWMLRAIGQPAAVLEGGLAEWSGPVETGEVVLPPVVRRPRPWPAERLADADLTRELARQDHGVVLDARDPARYAGEFEPIDPRPGHVPGAINLPCAGNLGAAGRLRSREELVARFATVGVLDAAEVVSYCGSGVTSCHHLLVLETLGVTGRLFPGSWSAWSADPTRDTAVGPDPG